MASRRTRIKGIANIPQRRKTGNPDEPVSAKADPALKIGSARDEEEEGPSSNHLSPQESPIPIKEANSGPEEEDTPPPPPENVKPTNDAIQKGELEKNSTSRRLPILARRKFIKPSISAVNRKSKLGHESLDAGSIRGSSLQDQKIIILNEVVKYPDQSAVIHIKKDDFVARAANVPQAHISEQQPLQTTATSPITATTRILPAPTSDVEYPVPPPSPTKFNRTRIKAVPRLGQRHHSFSASESEDESRRNNRIRNDSVCSTASAATDNTTLPECLSPQKPKEFSTVIQRKCRRTEQSRKLAEARREFYIKFGNDKPDRRKLTMMDLIFYNPTTNLMNQDEKKPAEKETAKTAEKVQEPEKSGDEDDPHKSDEKEGSDEENEIPAPQIKIGPGGKIILDEQSLVIESKSVKRGREDLQKSELVDGDFDSGYGHYKRAKRSKDWSKSETLTFYKALNTLGTDFTLMCELFPRRTRRELKLKFKKEERVNRTLIDKAIMNPCGFDYDDIRQEVEMEEREQEEIQKLKDRESELRKNHKSKRRMKTPVETPNTPEPVKKPAKKIRKFDILDVLDDDIDADVSDIEDDSSDIQILKSLQKPTRSGRVPKILDRYGNGTASLPPSSEELNTATEAPKGEPGSLMVVTSTGPNGAPVYKVFMVTGEHSRKQIGDDVDSLSKAMALRGVQNIFTLTAEQTGAENAQEVEENVPEIEHNITIAHTEIEDV